VDTAMYAKTRNGLDGMRAAHQRAVQQQHALRHQWMQANSAWNPHNAEAEKHEARILELRKHLESLTAKRATLEGELEHLRFWKVGFGPKGLKSYILDTRLEEMTTEANRWVHLLTGGTVWVRFETQRQVGAGSKKKLVDTFSIRVFRHNPDGTITERNYKSWSGGEKHRIGLGIDFGLARLVASRAKGSYNLLVLDEIFQKSLDSSGKEAVAELLLHLAKEKSTILVIDHDVMFQGLFEETIAVEKQHGRSRVVGVSDAQQPIAAQSVHSLAEVLASHPAFP
jgi:DNA repair exonuclease SbcCD ATPase subunit